MLSDLTLAAVHDPSAATYLVASTHALHLSAAASLLVHLLSTETVLELH